jgi:hypothetical protein
MRETSTVHVFKGQKVRGMWKKRFKEPLSLKTQRHVCAETSKANNATNDGKEKKVREGTIPVILSLHGNCVKSIMKLTRNKTTLDILLPFPDTKTKKRTTKAKNALSQAISVKKVCADQQENECVSHNHRFKSPPRHTTTSLDKNRTRLPLTTRAAQLTACDQVAPEQRRAGARARS